MMQRPKRVAAARIATLAAVYYPDDDATGVIPSNRILDLSACEVNAMVTIRWSKDETIAARLIAMSDSREELEDAIDNFEDDLDEDVFEDEDMCTAPIKDVELDSPSNRETSVSPTRTACTETSETSTTENDMQTSSREIEYKEKSTQTIPPKTTDANIATETSCLERLTDIAAISSQSTAEEDSASKPMSSPHPPKLTPFWQNDAKQDSSTMGSDLKNTSLPLLNLSGYFPDFDVETQYRMIRVVDANHSALKEIQDSLDEIKEILKKMLPKPVETEPFASKNNQQPSSTAAGDIAMPPSIFASRESTDATPKCTSTPKTPVTVVKSLPKSIFTSVDMLIAKPTVSSKPTTTQKLPKSIFASIESLASSSNPSSSTPTSTSQATIQVAQSIFGSGDFPAASEDLTSTGLVSIDCRNSAAGE